MSTRKKAGGLPSSGRMNSEINMFEETSTAYHVERARAIFRAPAGHKTTTQSHCIVPDGFAVAIWPLLKNFSCGCLRQPKQFFFLIYTEQVPEETQSKHPTKRVIRAKQRSNSTRTPRIPPTPTTPSRAPRRSFDRGISPSL